MANKLKDIMKNLFIISILLISNLFSADREFQYYLAHHQELSKIFIEYGITKENAQSFEELGTATEFWLEITYSDANNEKKYLTLIFDANDKYIVAPKKESPKSDKKIGWCFIN